jgi:hypothetical protein
VAETDMVMSRSSCSSMRLRVDFPAPDGEAMTSMTPRRPERDAVALRGLLADRTLFDILDLLAKLFHDRFQIEADGRQSDIIRFCT